MGLCKSPLRSAFIPTLYHHTSPPLIKQLIAYTERDDAVRAYTEDATRFHSFSSFAVWKKKGRTIYALLEKENRLMGIFWIGESAPPTALVKHPASREPMLTCAVRLYAEARGKGLAVEFILACFRAYFTYHPLRAIWLKTKTNNIPSIRTYEKLGFGPPTIEAGNNSVIAVLSKEQIKGLLNEHCRKLPQKFCHKKIQLSVKRKMGC